MEEGRFGGMLMVVVNIFNCGYVWEVHTADQDGSPASPHAQGLDSLHHADAFGAAVPPLLLQSVDEQPDGAGLDFKLPYLQLAAGAGKG